jgi:hypothetical protein
VREYLYAFAGDGIYQIDFDGTVRLISQVSNQAYRLMRDPVLHRPGEMSSMLTRSILFAELRREGLAP